MKMEPETPQIKLRINGGKREAERNPGSGPAKNTQNKFIAPKTIFRGRRRRRRLNSTTSTTRRMGACGHHARGGHDLAQSHHHHAWVPYEEEAKDKGEKNG